MVFWITSSRVRPLLRTFGHRERGQNPSSRPVRTDFHCSLALFGCQVAFESSTIAGTLSEIEVSFFEGRWGSRKSGNDHNVKFDIFAHFTLPIWRQRGATTGRTSPSQTEISTPCRRSGFSDSQSSFGLKNRWISLILSVFHDISWFSFVQSNHFLKCVCFSHVFRSSIVSFPSLWKATQVVVNPLSRLSFVAPEEWMGATQIYL